jgi:hypothetical protein
LANLVRKERKGKRQGAAGSAAAAAAGGAVEKKERKWGEGETDEWGPGVSESKEKEKSERTRAGAGRGMVGCWAAWPKGWPALVFFFSSSSFSNKYSFQIQIKPFKLFLKNFINFLETTQATKNHASQLMMHKHLLSLYLLNYV